MSNEDPLHELELELKQRRDAQRHLGKKIDSILKQSGTDETQNTGCFALISALFGRRRRDSTAVTSSEVAGSAETVPRRTGHSVFGLAAGKRIDATSQLKEAAEAIRMRVQNLEQRVSEHRAEAKQLMQSGQKKAALRALQKANTVQKQVDSNLSAVDAVEQQLDALSQAAMQKTLANALAATSKTMKKDSKVIVKAESAIDEAQEARDIANDLDQVMTDFAANGKGCQDEEELIAELDAMMTGDDNPAPPPAATTARADAHTEAARQLDVKHAQWDAAEAIRSRMPEAPTNLNGKAKSVERAGLLQG